MHKIHRQLCFPLAVFVVTIVTVLQLCTMLSPASSVSGETRAAVTIAVRDKSGGAIKDANLCVAEYGLYFSSDESGTIKADIPVKEGAVCTFIFFADGFTDYVEFGIGLCGDETRRIILHIRDEIGPAFYSNTGLTDNDCIAALIKKHKRLG